MKNNKKIIVATLIFIISFTLLSVFKNLPNFTDEADNMLAAMKIANGGSIYLDYYAHHMPLMYYILTPFAMLGVASTHVYRLCFYGILALIWAFMYYRYSDKVDKRLLIIYPIFYIIFMSIDVNYSIISEHIQAQALVILLLELIMFSKNFKLTISSEIIISVCIFASIFSVFSSIVSIGILVIVILLMEKNKKLSFSQYFCLLWKKYKRLILFVCFPFIIMMAYYCLNGSIKEFYRQAFYFNTEVYSNYQPYPSNPILIILYTIANYFISLKDNFLLLFSTPTITSIVQLFFLVGPFIYLATSKNKSKYLIAIFVISCGNRSFTGIHSLAYYAASTIITFTGLFQLKKVYYLSVISICISAYMPFLTKISEPLNNIKVITNDYDYMTVQAITNHENDVYYLNLMLENYVNTNRLPATRAMTIFPWFQDMFEDELLDDLKKNRPRVISYRPTDNVWGYTYQNYLEKIDPYIRENYTYANMIRIGYSYSTWIRNDYVEEVEKILNLDIPDYTNDYGNIIALPGSENLKSNLHFEQDYVDNIAIKFNTYNRLNTSTIKIVLKDSNEKEIFSTKISASDIIPDQFHVINIDKEVNVNENYYLEIINENTFVDNYVMPYGVTLKYDDNENYIILNNQETQYEVCMNIYYRD